MFLLCPQGVIVVIVEALKTVWLFNIWVTLRLVSILSVFILENWSHFPGLLGDKQFWIIEWAFIFKTSIYLAAPVLSCGMWDLAYWLWDWTPGPLRQDLAILSHWTIKESRRMGILNIMLYNGVLLISGKWSLFSLFEQAAIQWLLLQVLPHLMFGQWLRSIPFLRPLLCSLGLPMCSHAENRRGSLSQLTVPAFLHSIFAERLFSSLLARRTGFVRVEAASSVAL